MPTPNEAMREEARRGLDWRREYGRGGTEVGIARARDISNGENLSMETVGRMSSYFARHEVDKEAEGFRPGEDGYPSNGRIAWALWGGDAGQSWANRIMDQEDDDRAAPVDEGGSVVVLSQQPMEADMQKRAGPDELSVGDYVSWDSSGGSAYGQIERIERDGQIDVPDSDFTVNGEEDDPAALIMVYRETEDGWSPSGVRVGHRFSTLTKVSARGYKDKDEERHIKRIEETEDEVIVVFHKEMDEMTEAAAAREVRPAKKIEVRNQDDGMVRVSGYAAVFGEETNIAGMFTESIEAGAFKNAISRQDDVVFLVNHDGLPLARTRSNTLRLTEDERGLYIETDLDPSDPDVRSIIPKMKRGDLDKMSFAFMPTRQMWDDRGELPKRIVQDVELFDVSVVTTPAYEGTEIGLRSLEAHRQAQRKSQAARRVRMKARLVE